MQLIVYNGVKKEILLSSARKIIYLRGDLYIVPMYELQIMSDTVVN